MKLFILPIYRGTVALSISIHMNAIARSSNLICPNELYIYDVYAFSAATPLSPGGTYENYLRKH